MSRYYGIRLLIAGHKPEKEEVIRDGARSEWEFADWDVYPDEINGYGESSLYAGEGEDEFAERLTHAIWQANGAHCSVKVTCTFLENAPFETYEFSEPDYEIFLKEAGNG